MKNYDHKKIEKKWQKIWDEKKTYQTLDAKKAKAKGLKPYYVLDMFPYPSGAGLHVGHPRGYIASDVLARMKRMQGFNVLHPMGFDSFGLPAEQYAIQTGKNPAVFTEQLVKHYQKQLSILGFSFDWSREVSTHRPEYYKWTQWIFLQIYNSYYDLEKNKARPISELVKKFEKADKAWKNKTELEKQAILMNYRLAYEGEASVNWCPELGTVLANDEIVDGPSGPVSERGGFPVEKKLMRQWFMRITAYGDRLIDGLADLDWPENIKEIQKNWIGKSEGAEIDFNIRTDPSPTLPKGKGEAPGYLTSSPENYRTLHDRAVEMKKNPTKAEEVLWRELKSNKAGYHFRRQHIVDAFIADFVCLEKSLIIEIDGNVHDALQDRDLERTGILEAHGFKVVRFSNEEVLKNAKSVVAKIVSEVQDSSDRKNSLFGDGASPLPLEGVGGRFDSITVFTTRADTLFGVTYVVLAPESPLVAELKSQIKNYKEVEAYIAEAAKKDEMARMANEKDKTGVRLDGVFAVNPANGESVPVWVADYVLANYGTGAVMGVPMHDDRDRLFATKYGIEVVDRPLVDPKAVTASVGGRMVTKYKFRDAIFARQRYWGEPIPLIHNDDGTVSDVKEKNLPLELPKVKSYQPSGTGESPLSTVKSWVKDGYETNTMPGWAGSSWYFLRYMDPHNKKAFAGEDEIGYWKNVDMYVGGQEHATGHLMYSRFWHKVLKDLGFVKTEEPFKALRNQGMIGGADGRKMSKRWGNVINPDEVVNDLGADTLRLYESFMGPFESHLPWSIDGIVGARRFVERVWKIAGKVQGAASPFRGGARRAEGYEKVLHKTIKKVTEDIANFSFNTAVSAMMICVNEFEKAESISESDFKKFLQILAPFAPHMTEELWDLFHHPLTPSSTRRGDRTSIHLSPWPKFDANKIVDDTVTLGVQVNGKVRAEVSVSVDATEEEVRMLVLAIPEIEKWIEGKPIRKFIFIPKRIISIVI